MPDRTRRRGLRPILERVEERAMLSSSATIAFTAAHPRLSASVRTYATGSGSNTGGGSSTVTPPANSLINPTGNPTPHELARERFRATFKGPFVVGVGRFDTQSMLINVRGVGRDTYSLHADVQIGIVIPKDSTQPINGVLVINDRNNNSNTTVGLDLIGDPTSLDSAGRPTHFTFQTDVNLSSGVFAESTSSGTVDIRYNRLGGRNGRVLGSGNSTVVVSGLAYTIGSTNLLRNANLNP